MRQRPLIYLAAPFTSPNKVEMAKRHLAVVNITTEFMKLGYVVYSPIAVGPTVEGDIKWTHEQWLDYDRQILRHCDEIHVLMLPGWDKSKGVLLEIEMAKEFGMPVKYVDIKPFLPEDQYKELLLVYNVVNYSA